MKHEVTTGIRMSLAVGLGMFPLGVAFGLLVLQAGLPWWVAPLTSCAVYAGSLELLLISLMTGGAPLATVALTTFFVNFRHVFYSFSFPLRVLRGRFARVYSVYAMTDEAYAITTAHPHGWTPARLIALQVSLQMYWVGGGMVGVLLGSLLPGQIKGLDFALCALFITLTLDAARSLATVPSLLLAALSFAIAIVATPGAVIFTSMLLFAASLGIRYLFTRNKGAWPYA
ncbi:MULTISPECIES: AzlC family ABC transporter permease [unclassified Actinobaculum]|uniref:AzlC family ABC transporter permease n=1 Tax=unclassified Actinobaculum TaxID=2609299 RepID=UPI001F0C597B|nr:MULTISPECIES: AzlC family ABC transporter permease [unclassified Actinobaculum]